MMFMLEIFNFWLNFKSIIVFRIFISPILLLFSSRYFHSNREKCVLLIEKMLMNIKAEIN